MLKFQKSSITCQMGIVWGGQSRGWKERCQNACWTQHTWCPETPGVLLLPSFWSKYDAPQPPTLPMACLWNTAGSDLYLGWGDQSWCWDSIIGVASHLMLLHQILVIPWGGNMDCDKSTNPGNTMRQEYDTAALVETWPLWVWIGGATLS